MTELPGQDDRQDRSVHHRWLLAVAAAVVLGSGLAACGSGTVTAARYASAKQIIAAINHGGLRCTGVQETSGSPSTPGATSEASCQLGSTDDAYVDTFPGKVTTAMVMRDSVSGGSQRIWNVIGPNWTIMTGPVSAGRIKKILGGKIMPGPAPGIPSAAATAPAAALTCSSIDSLIQPLVAGLRKEYKLHKEMNSGPAHLSTAVEEDMTAGGWTDPGTYSRPLDSFLATEGNVSSNEPSQPPQLAGDVAATVSAGSALQSDVSQGGIYSGQPIQRDWPNFQQAVIAMSNDCRMTPPIAWP